MMAEKKQLRPQNFCIDVRKAILINKAAEKSIALSTSALGALNDMKLDDN